MYLGAVYKFNMLDPFDSKSWSQTRKITPRDGQEGDGFGWIVATQSDYLLVGSWSDDSENYTDIGILSFYRLIN
jgi:hypothetical protein